MIIFIRKWGDILEYAPPTRYSYPHGQCRSVGVGGYLLGGGVNWLGTYNKVIMVLHPPYVVVNISSVWVRSRAYSLHECCPRWWLHRLSGQGEVYQQIRSQYSSLLANHRTEQRYSTPVPVSSITLPLTISSWHWGYLSFRSSRETLFFL